MTCLRSKREKLSESGYKTDMLDTKAPAFWDLMMNNFGFSANTGYKHRHRCGGCSPRTCASYRVVAVRRSSVKRSRNKATQ